jgi:hypothetical protein
MKLYKSLIGVLLFVSTMTVHSNPGAWMPEAKKIVEIIVEGGDEGRALIVIEGNVPSDYVPEGCKVGDDRAYNTVYLNTDKGKSIYSLALTAYMSGKPVKLAVGCIGARPLITHIRF